MRRIGTAKSSSEELYGALAAVSRDEQHVPSTHDERFKAVHNYSPDLLAAAMASGQRSEEDGVSPSEAAVDFAYVVMRVVQRFDDAEVLRALLPSDIVDQA